QRLLEVDDVDARALPVQVPPHLRVPAPGLVPEVDTRLEELPPGHDGHAPPPFGYASARLLPRRPGLRRDLGRGPRTCVLGALAPARWQSSSGFTPRPRRYRRRRSGSSGTSSSMAIHRYVKAARKPVCRKVARSAYSHVANPGLTVSRFASGANATRMGRVRKMYSIDMITCRLPGSRAARAARRRVSWRPRPSRMAAAGANTNRNSAATRIRIEPRNPSPAPRNGSTIVPATIMLIESTFTATTTG